MFRFVDIYRFSSANTEKKIMKTDSHLWWPTNTERPAAFSADHSLHFHSKLTACGRVTADSVETYWAQQGL